MQAGCGKSTQMVETNTHPKLPKLNPSFYGHRFVQLAYYSKQYCKTKHFTGLCFKY